MPEFPKYHELEISISPFNVIISGSILLNWVNILTNWMMFYSRSNFMSREVPKQKSVLFQLFKLLKSR